MSNKIRAWVIGRDMSVYNFLNKDPLIQPMHGDFSNRLDQVDMLVFTGGEDVHPEYYGQENKHSHWMNKARDELEIALYMATRDTHYHFGICRGMQLFAVANGQTLWQDISGHQLGGEHIVQPISGRYKNRQIHMTSVHHQAMKETLENRQHILAYAYDNNTVAKDDTDKPTSLYRVVEAVWFEKTKSFGVQGHPEYSRACKEFQEFVLYHLIEDPDTGYYANKRKGHA